MVVAAGAVVADRYRLERPLGQGGMGAVWSARHVTLQMTCAVKFIHAQAAEIPEIRARFEREAVTAAQLKSPHVVQILDHGVWEGLPYIAMEMLDGEDLGQRLARVGVLAPGAIVAIVAQVARALTKAHAAGLVHRDLKPANIFLARDDENEIAKVLDFGVAKINALESTDSNTKTGALLGTPFYMSPEQARGVREVDSRSDLWSLAVVVFQCLTGRLPFISSALGDLLVQIIMNPLPIPSQVAPVPPGFDAWWLRATARDPAQRFQTAKELSEALALALGVSTSSAGMSVPALVGSAPALADPRANTPWGAPMPAATPMPPAETGTPVVAPMPPFAAPSPPKRGALAAVAGVVALVAVVGLAAALKGSSSPAAPAGSTAPDPRVETPSAPVAAPSVAAIEPALPAPPAPSALPVASASAQASAAPSPSASASAAPRVKGKTNGAPRDVGF